jgi:hypothetical protein
LVGCREEILVGPAVLDFVGTPGGFQAFGKGQFVKFSRKNPPRRKSHFLNAVLRYQTW